MPQGNKRSRRETGGALSRRKLSVPGGLTPAQYEFCLAWLANGFNASAAYRQAHDGVTDGTARVEGHRTLANPKVLAFLRKQLGERWKPLHMDGDEALARVSLDARCDPRLMCDADGKLLPLHQWPDEFVNSVEAIEFDGGTIRKVKLASKAGARRVILEATGKLKGSLDGGIDALAALLARKYDAEVAK